MKTKSPLSSTFSTFLATLGLFVTFVPGPAAAAELTYCQEHGHGANGCSDQFENGGYCVENNEIGNTGYICSEDDPNENSGLIGSDEVLDTADPVIIRTVEGDDEPGTTVPSEPIRSEDSLF